MLPVVGFPSPGDLQCLSHSVGLVPITEYLCSPLENECEQVLPCTGDAHGVEWGYRHSPTAMPPARPGMGANYSQGTQRIAPAFGILNSSQRLQGIGLNLPAVTGSCNGQCSPSDASGAVPGLNKRRWLTPTATHWAPSPP